MAAPRSIPVAAIVDGYSTGNFLPDAFDRLGVTVVHVQGDEELNPSTLVPDLTKYSDAIVCADDSQLDTAVKALRQHNPIAVLAGQEPGVILADRLSELLGLPSNGSALSLARRDKYRMIEAVRAAGLRCADQLVSADPEAIVRWSENRGSYPVVVKPLTSASTDHVTICLDAAQTRAAALDVLSACNIYDEPNTAALVQSYLDGTEYIVDTVSVDGRMFACGVWKYEKTVLPGGKNIYDKDVLLDPDQAPVPELLAYTNEVLRALNIRYGPAHVEVIMTAAGPALVELGARLNGNMNPGFHDVCLGANQADLIALAYARPQDFLNQYADNVYTKRQPAVVHNTSTTLAGEVVGINQETVDKISALPTVWLLSVKLAPGKQVRPTVDLLSSPMRIFMTGPDEAAIQADYETIQRLKDEVYQLQ